ncbi:thioredoxin family protein [Zavarzinia compransoris]|uniref:protein-disulfide reductase DsbD family protein n=1 Tax=Zavarzinia marina TaxID=2911065 RepID=UPI001F3B0D7B|nr:protein-disulfide reductase DsbD domain-containing protein [Zavarzinia marina]MCF4164313.1 thioredoxin family protein [Zavarzinia marina]
MPKILLRLCLLLALGLSALAPAAAAPVRTENAEAELVAEGVAVPGATVTVALRLVARPGWHTYWLNPGDTGLPTTIAWTLPEGVGAGPIQWPLPEALPVGPFVNYGYEGEVWLLSDIAVPKDFTGDRLDLAARADWLICAEICVPEGADLSLSIPVAATPSRDPAHLLGFEKSRALLPLPLPAPAVAARQGETLEILLPQDIQAKAAHFFPDQPGTIIAAAPQALEGSRLTATLEQGFAGERLTGVLVIESDGWTRGFTVDTAIAGVVPAAVTVSPAAVETAPPGAGGTAATSGIGLLLALGLAFLGGMILNLMPCVLPVLSIKLLSLSGRAPGAAMRHHGLAYTAGVLSCFALLAGALLTLRAGGDAIGWGFQLQSPLVVALLAYLFFVLGLWMLDIVSFGAGFMGLGDRLTRHAGPAGSFGIGLLAAVVATPCTGPFMATALGFALTRPPAEALGIFLALGLGLAAPFLAVSFVPGLARLLPKPGGWMLRLKKILAFPLFASAVWLLWVLSVQTGANAVAAAGAGLVLLAFAAFVLREFAGPGAKLVGLAAAIVAVVLAALPMRDAQAPGVTAHGPAGAEAYSAESLASYRAAGRAVFVNMTAAWCITCLVNEQVALDRPAVREALAATDTVYMVGDWTNRDPAITRMLAEHGRSGVPLYVVYPAGGGAPRVLPQLLTEGIVVEALSQP